MLTLLPIPSLHVVGIKVSGKVERTDVDNLIREINLKLETEKSLNIYLELESFSGISFDALVEELKFAFPNLESFHRKAVVSDNVWLEKAVRVGGKLFGDSDVICFTPKEKERALSWVIGD